MKWPSHVEHREKIDLSARFWSENLMKRDSWKGRSRWGIILKYILKEIAKMMMSELNCFSIGPSDGSLWKWEWIFWCQTWREISWIHAQQLPPQECIELPGYNPTLLLEELSKITKHFSYYSCQLSYYSNRVLQEHTQEIQCFSALAFHFVAFGVVTSCSWTPTFRRKAIIPHQRWTLTLIRSIILLNFLID